MSSIKRTFIRTDNDKNSRFITENYNWEQNKYLEINKQSSLKKKVIYKEG